MKITYTPRGFRIAEFKDANGNACSIQESSCVLPRLWIGIQENRMHLDRRQAEALIPFLSYFVNHGTLPPPRSKKGTSKSKH